MRLRVYRPHDGLWLAKVSRHHATWLRDEGQVLSFTHAELHAIAKWTMGCEFVPVPLQQVTHYEWTYG